VRYSSKLLICLCLTLAIVLVYGQVIDFDFVGFDDELYVTENFNVQKGFTVKGLKWAFSNFHSANWHPITWLSHMLDCELYGLNPMGHHWTNIEFHIAAWVAERKDVLSTFFWLLTMLAYLRYVKKPVLIRYFMVLFSFVLGLMSKPMLVTLPFVLLLLDLWPLKRFQFKNDLQSDRVAFFGFQGFLRLFLEKIPLFIPVIISCSLTFLAQKNFGAVKPLASLPLIDRISNALVTYVTYALKTIWPSNLAVFYPHPENTLPAWQIIGAALLIAVAIFLSIRTLKKYPYIAVGLFWYLGTLVPVIGLVQVGDQAMADRYTYIPIVGLFIIVAWGASGLTLKWHYRKIFLVVSWASILTALTACAYFQASHWKNDITLFQYALKVTDNNWPAHYNLGVTWHERGKFDEAVLQFEQVLKIKPDHAGARNNLANILFNHGQFKEATLQLKKALRYKPHDADICNNLAVVLVSQEKFDEAISLFEQAININSEHAHAHFNLGSLLVRKGKFKSAGRHFAEAIRISPDYAEAYNEIGVILFQQGKYKKAEVFFSKAVQIKPRYTEARKNIELLNKILSPDKS